MGATEINRKLKWARGQALLGRGTNQVPGRAIRMTFLTFWGRVLEFAAATVGALSLGPEAADFRVLRVVELAAISVRALALHPKAADLSRRGPGFLLWNPWV